VSPFSTGAGVGKKARDSANARVAQFVPVAKEYHVRHREMLIAFLAKTTSRIDFVRLKVLEVLTLRSMKQKHEFHIKKQTLFENFTLLTTTRPMTRRPIEFKTIGWS